MALTAVSPEGFCYHSNFQKGRTQYAPSLFSQNPACRPVRSMHRCRLHRHPLEYIFAAIWSVPLFGVLFGYGPTGGTHRKGRATLACGRDAEGKFLMTPSMTLCLLSAGGFLLTGMLLGVWKYHGVMTRPDHRAHIYVDMAHRAAL